MKHSDIGGATPAAGRVGLFWGIRVPKGSVQLLTASCEIAEGEPYGERVTYPRGHYECWHEWRNDLSLKPELRRFLRSHEYEEWPRGRVVYDLPSSRFVILCDRKLMTPTILRRIRMHFLAPSEATDVLDDSHYRSTRTLDTRRPSNYIF